MLKFYFSRLAVRSIVLLWAVWLYFVDPGALEIEHLSFFSEFSKAHIIWALLLATMLLPCLPHTKVSLGCLKQHKKYYHPSEAIDRQGLAEYIKQSDQKALIIAAAWSVCNLFLWLLYWTERLGAKELLLAVLFFSVCDLVCVLFFCPFQLVMKNRCCVTCRIFSWDHFMMVMPLIPIFNFFSYSLCLFAFVLLIAWESTWRRHPERYWDKSNRALQCRNCQTPLCQLKKLNRTKG